jgi:hypothetical protein
MQMGRYMTAYKVSFLWPSREFLMICAVRGRPSLPLGSEGPAKVQTARRALTPNPAFAGAQKARFSQFEKARLIGMLILTIIVDVAE